MKLKNIKILLPCLSDKDTYPKFVGCPEVKAVLQQELAKLDRKRRELKNSRDAVAGFLCKSIPDDNKSAQET